MKEKSFSFIPKEVPPVKTAQGTKSKKFLERQRICQIAFTPTGIELDSEQEAIRNRIISLSEKQERTLRLVFIDGVKVSEVAKIENVPPVRIYKYIGYAMSYLTGERIRPRRKEKEVNQLTLDREKLMLTLLSPTPPEDTKYNKEELEEKARDFKKEWFEILEMRFIKKMRTKEIAKTLGIAPNSVSRIIREITLRLDPKLENEFRRKNKVTEVVVFSN